MDEGNERTSLDHISLDLVSSHDQYGEPPCGVQVEAGRLQVGSEETEFGVTSTLENRLHVPWWQLKWLTCHSGNLRTTFPLSGPSDSMMDVIR